MPPTKVLFFPWNLSPEFNFGLSWRIKTKLCLSQFSFQKYHTRMKHTNFWATILKVKNCKLQFTDNIIMHASHSEDSDSMSSQKVTSISFTHLFCEFCPFLLVLLVTRKLSSLDRPNTVLRLFNFLLPWFMLRPRLETAYIFSQGNHLHNSLSVNSLKMMDKTCIGTYYSFRMIYSVPQIIKPLCY